ncbi:hypothetical protein U3A55_12585 [Salarchaeum sp. III]|uniref:hypothetical protein n=1 Tax=Salarchaeum sp. III TaxID=3107927 RepID=UPI002ED8B103
MEYIATVLAKQGAGPVTVEVDDEWTHEIQLEYADVEEDGFFAEGRDREGDDVAFEFRTPKTENEPITLYRKHARDDEWEEVGRVTDVAED